MEIPSTARRMNDCNEINNNLNSNINNRINSNNNNNNISNNSLFSNSTFNIINNSDLNISIDNNISSAVGQSISDVLIISMTEDYDMCAETATKLRENGLNVQINIENQKIGKKFKYANNINVKYVIIIGEDEIKNKVVALKNMITGTQDTVSLEDAIKIIKVEK